MIWHLCVTLSAKFLLHVLWIRYHFITAKQEGCDSLHIYLKKNQQHYLASMSKCNFPLRSVLNWNREIAHASVWYLIFGKIFCSSGHNFNFEILGGSHTITGQQKGKLAFTKSSKVQSVKYCMKLISKELESIWKAVQEFVVQISPQKLKRKQKDKYLCEYKYWRRKKKRKAASYRNVDMNV